MGMIRLASVMTNSMKDSLLHWLGRDQRFGGDRTLAATGHEGRGSETHSIAEYGQALDSSRSRGFGRYEI
jgi:hypothetical protein